MTTAVLDADPRPEQFSALPGPTAAVPALPRTDVPGTLAEKMQLADQLAMAQGDMFPAWLRGKAANFLAVMYAAQALDIPVWTAAQGLYAEGGSVGIEASLMRALVQRAGHLIYTEDSSPFHASVVVVRWNVPDRPYRASFTMEEALRAGLAGQENYQRYPEPQMIARATARACREGAADVLAGFVYTPDELQSGFRQDRTPAAPPPPDVPAETVDKLCAAIDAAEDLPAVKKVWKATAKAGALAATCQGEALVSRLQARFAAVAPGQPVAATAILAPVQDPTGGPEPTGPPPGPAEPVLASCGCPTEVIHATGTHLVDCAQYTAPAPPPPSRRPAKKTPAKTTRRAAKR